MAALHLSADLVGVRTGAPTLSTADGRYWDRATRGVRYSAEHTGLDALLSYGSSGLVQMSAAISEPDIGS